MRVLLFLTAALAGLASAQAQTNVYYAERGHWLVASTGKVCRALNRPPVDFNGSPYNALQIAVRPGSTIGVEVFLWPQAIDLAQAYRLVLSFSPGDAITLDAQAAMGDYMLASVQESKLWRLFQDAKTLHVTVAGQPTLDLTFGLDGMDWVLNSLGHCASLLPKD